MKPYKFAVVPLFVVAGLALGCSAKEPDAGSTSQTPKAEAPPITASWSKADLFVALGNANAVAGVDADELPPLTVAVGRNLHGLAITPDGRRLLAPSMVMEGDISVVEVASGKVTTSLPAGGMAHHAAIGAAGRYGFVTVAPDRLVVVDLPEGREVRRLQAGAGANYVEASPDGRRVFVANQEAGTVTVVDAEKLAIIDTIRVGKGPDHITVAGDTLYVALSGEGAVAEVSLTKGTVTRTFTVGQSPHGVALTGGGRTLLATTSDALAAVDLESGRVTKQPLPGDMAHVTASADGSQAYVAVPAWNALAVWDEAERRLLGTLPLGAPPHQVVLAPGAAPIPPARLEPLPGATAPADAGGSRGNAGDPAGGMGGMGGMDMDGAGMSEHERHHQ